ncbi:MAG: haloacid dehalogenase-like hydrolase [Candidatus Promineifilaceae bacterium]|nr:haloacid dehalogenase-like hydrolase [Candidatus Promineifilaceae bacterium]
MPQPTSSLLTEPAGNRSETVATDLEGTLSSGVAWEGMRDYLMANGRDQAFKRFFLRQMPRYALFKLGIVNRDQMKEAWILGLLKLFKGIEPQQMSEMGQFVVEETLWPTRRKALLAELEAHRDQGRRVIITTGQIEPILAEFLQKLDGYEGLGTAVTFEDGRFSGKVAGNLLQGSLKANALQPFARDGRIYAAYGDTTTDIPMLSMSARPVAVDPDPDLRLHAQQQGWRILEAAPLETDLEDH